MHWPDFFATDPMSTANQANFPTACRPQNDSCQKLDNHRRLPRIGPRFLLALFVCNLSLSAPLLAQDQPDTPPLQPAAARQYDSVEERRLMELIQVPGSGSLAQARAELENRKMELKILESEVDKKIEELNQLRRQVEDLLAQKEAEELNRIEELARVYERMSGEKAALILATIDENLAVALLAAMKPKAAAIVLNNMEREKAANLTHAFSTLDNR